MNKSTATRKPQHLAYKLGLMIGILGLALLLFPAYDRFHAHGPMNSGHDTLKCVSCHQDAPGSLRQQIQANLRYALKLRERLADFGHQAVSNENCLNCHERPNDRHPVYRFLEPRFLKARENLSPQHCVSCHTEHKGQRITRAEIGYCVNCHKKTRLRKDPLDVPHDRLIALKRWESCLGCHDFHGNHIMKTKKTVEQIIPAEKIHDYFQGGASPYGDDRHYEAKKEVDND
jgi:Cytochrome c3